METENTEPQETEETEEIEAPEAETETEDDGDGFDPEKAREKLRKLNSENRNLRKRAKENEDKAKGADEKDGRITSLEAENLRYRIGIKHGLPESLVKRLSGTTEEELLQDAEELMELFGSKKPPTNRPKETLRGGTDPTTPVEETDLDALGKKYFG